MNWKEVLFQTYLVALPVFMSYIVWLLKQSRRERSANAEGTKVLLMIKLMEYHDKYCEIGNVPSYVYQNYCNLYNAYRGLGGNGMIKRMKEEFDALEIK